MIHHAVAALVVAWATVAVLAQPAAGSIVSTSPSITETLFALGLGDRVVGVSTYCRYPEAATRLPRVGTYLQPDAELIARLRPDLVFVHPGPNRIKAKLDALGIPNATVEQGALPSVSAAIREVGAAAGVPDRADRLIRDIDQKLAAVSAAVANRRPRKVLVIVGRRTGTLTDMVAVGRQSYLSDILTLAGGTNVMAGSTLSYPRISMETVISLAPDVIVDVGEMGETQADSDRRRTATEDLWRRQTLVKAVRDGGVHATNDEAFVVPGPRIVDVARTMAQWFHGVQAP